MALRGVYRSERTPLPGAPVKTNRRCLLSHTDRTLTGVKGSALGSAVRMESFEPQASGEVYGVLPQFLP